MVYLKLTIISITGFIGMMHCPAHVSCQIFPTPPGIGPPNIFSSDNGLRLFPRTVVEPVPALDRRSDERRTIILIEDSTLQNGDEFDSGFDGGLQNVGGFGGGFGSILVLVFLPFLLMSLGLGVNTTTASVTSTTTMDAATTTPVAGVVTPTATVVTTVTTVPTTTDPTTTAPPTGGSS